MTETKKSNDVNKFNSEDIEKTYQLLGHQKETEIRLIEVNKDKDAKSIPKHVRDIEQFSKICKQYAGSRFNIYVGINERKISGTKDDDVIRVTTYCVDVDPVRPKNTSSNEIQLKKSREVTKKMVDYIISNGFKRPSIAMSGNGFQLWIRLKPIKITNNNRDTITKKIQTFQKELQDKFKTEEVNIDSIHNLSRVMKVIGTISVKGEEHRLSYWLSYNNEEDPIISEYILNLPIDKLDSIEIKKIDTKQKDETRSGKEFRECIKLIGKGLTKEELFKEMEVFTKWSSSPPQYREITYKKAKEYVESQKEKNRTTKEDIDSESLEILQNQKLIELLCDEAQKKIVEERDTIKTILICAFGMNVENYNIASYNLLVNSESSAGKDYVVANSLSILPNEEYIKRTRISPTVFTYWHNPRIEPTWTWDKKTFYCEDISSGVLNSDVFKVMCSTGSSATVVINQIAVDIEIKGKPVMIVTTASATPSKELTRRFAIINLDETINQTEAIMRRTAEVESEGLSLKQDPRIKKALSYLKRVKVKVGYARELVDFFPKKHLIMRTHFPRFIDLIKATTSLYQFQREKNENGAFISTGEDYDIAREVLLKMTSNPYMIPLTQQQRKILKVFEDLANNIKSVLKYKCSNCGLICDSIECPKCWDYSGSKKIKFVAEQYSLKKFGISDLEPLMTFFTGSERWLREQLKILVNYGFLEETTEKRTTSDKPLNVYNYVKNLISINIPKWSEICQNSSNTSSCSNSSFSSNTSNTIIDMENTKEHLNHLNHLNKMNGGAETAETSETNTDKVLSVIPTQGMVSTKYILDSLKDNVEEGVVIPILKNLSKKGDIFEPKPDFWQRLE